MSVRHRRAFEPTLLPANRAAELVDEFVFARVVEQIDTTGLQRLEAEIWSMLIELDVDCAGRSPVTHAREMITRALLRFVDDPIRTTTRLDECAACAIASHERSSAG